MNNFLIELTENISDQVITDLDCFGVTITWANKWLPHLIIGETNKTKEELEDFFLIETANKENDVTLGV